MDVLIELIFDNIIFLFVIIAGLLSFFNRLMSGTKQQENEQSESGRSQRQSEGTGRQTVREVMRRMQEMAESLDPETATPQRRTAESEGHHRETEQASTKSTASEPKYSFEQQRDEQFKRLQKQYESGSQAKEIDTAIDPDSPIYAQAHAATTRGGAQQKTRQTKTTVDLKSRLNADGLIESVIMAEVLGPPRARKRYSNRYLER